jgi:SAM-dependent methyltransferase/uncharacterized protein YbaR (Trm112 family)
MRPHLLELICCPLCASDLRLTESTVASTTSGADVQVGCLTCLSGHLFPIVAGIPRLLDDSLSEFPGLVDQQRKLDGATNHTTSGIGDAGQRQVRDRFEAQWDRWGNEERIFGKTLAQMIENITNERIGSHIRADYYPGKRVLDAGCGHGRYLAAFSQLGAEAVGVDIGHGIDVARRYNQENPNVYLIQGDLMRVPLKSSTFDLVFSDGVLHHTPSTRDAFFQIANLVKPGGYLYVWLYPKGNARWEYSQRAIRSVTTRLPPKLLYYLCFAAVPLLSVVKTYSGTSLRNSSWAVRAGSLGLVLAALSMASHRARGARMVRASRL